MKYRIQKKPEKLTPKKKKDLSYESPERTVQPRLIPANILAHAAQRWKNWSTAEKIAYTAIIILAVSSSITMAYYCFTYGFSAFYEMLDSYFNVTSEKNPKNYSSHEVGFFKNGKDVSSVHRSLALPEFVENISISWEPLSKKALGKTKEKSFNEFAALIRELLPQAMQPQLLQKIFMTPTVSTSVQSTVKAQPIRIKIATSTFLGQDRARFEFTSKTLYLRFEARPDKKALLRLLRNELHHALNQKTNEVIFTRNSLFMPSDSRQGNPFFTKKGQEDSKLLLDFSDAIKTGDTRINHFQKLFEKLQSREHMAEEEQLSLQEYLNVIAPYLPLMHYKTIYEMQLQQALSIGSFQESSQPGVRYVATKKRNPQLPFDLYITDVLTNDSEATVELKCTFAKDDSNLEKAKAFLADYTETRKIYYTREQAYYANKPDALMAQRASDIEEWDPTIRKYFYSELCEYLTKYHFENPNQEDYCASFN